MKFNINDIDKHKIGIYKIVNKINGKIYIGSTGNSFYNRFHQHISDYKKNKHNGVVLVRAFRRYGIENFEFSIVCICEEKNRLATEQIYIDMGVDYNSSKTAGSLLGLKHSPASKTRTITRGLHHSAKEVYQFSIEGDLIKKHLSVIDALKFIGKAKNGSSHITQSCIGKTYSSFGFRWSFSKTLYIRENRLGKHKILVTKNGYKNVFISHSEVVNFFHREGHLTVRQGSVSNALRLKNKLYNYKLEKL